MNNITEVVGGIDRRKLRSNVQRVLYRLLKADGGWVGLAEMNRVANSAGSRIRDLRKQSYGSFQVECKSAVSLGKRGLSRFFYRIDPNTVTRTQLNAVFEGVMPA